jgi:glyoxylase-like metal-dependent hydrolase (beta-lactamase superfamily II)
MYTFSPAQDRINIIRQAGVSKGFTRGKTPRRVWGMDQIIRIAGMENSYLMKGDHTYLVDTMAPPSRKKLYARLQENGVAPGDLSHILITHYHVDHVGNLASLLTKGNPAVVAGVEDAACITGETPASPPSELNRLGRCLRKMPPRLIEWYQKCKPGRVDEMVKDGDKLEELGLEIIGLPGHTRGGTAYLDRANRRAFIGDLISNYFGRIGLPPISSSYSLEDIEASIRKLAELDLDYMYPGHGRIIGPGASRLAAGLINKKFYRKPSSNC